MKKKTRSVKKAAAKKTVKRTTRTSNKNPIMLFPFSFRRVILVTTCLAVFAFVLVLSSGKGRQDVAGIAVTRGLFNQATVAIPHVDNAIYYNLYYKKDSEPTYKNAVRAIPPTVTSYTLSFLTKGANYTYKISAVDASGAEFSWTAEQPIANLQSM
ncbi:MAG TPA: fibronectin type III domain-containing protein [Patescibacteria group bacterium]